MLSMGGIKINLEVTEYGMFVFFTISPSKIEKKLDFILTLTQGNPLDLIVC